MNINDILESENTRLQIMKDNRSLQIMNNFKTITTISNTEYETIERVAEYFQVDYQCIKRLVARHKEELIKNGLIVANGTQTKQYLGGNMVSPTNFRGYFIIDNRKFTNKSNTLINKRCFLNIAMLLTESIVAEQLRNLMLDVILNNNTQTTDNTELYNIIVDLKREIQELKETIKTIQNDTVEDKVIKQESNIDKLTKAIKDLDRKTELTKKEFALILNSYIDDKHIGIKILNEILANNNMIRGNDIITNFAKENKYLVKKKLKTTNKVYITKKGMMYIISLL